MKNRNLPKIFPIEDSVFLFGELIDSNRFKTSAFGSNINIAYRHEVGVTKITPATKGSLIKNRILSLPDPVRSCANNNQKFN
jgi:hypothetical protein